MNKNADGFDVESLRLPAEISDESSATKPKARRSRVRRLYELEPDEIYLRGPIRWSWLAQAMQCPGHALHVGVNLWHHAYMKNSFTVELNLSRMFGEMHVSRDSARRGLAELENRKLVLVKRHTGRKPVVTITLDTTPANPRAASSATREGR